MGECPKVLIRLARASQLASSEGVRIGFALSIWQEAAGCDLNLHLRSSLKGRERIMNSIAQSGTAGEELTSAPIDPGVRIGHVHLKVADLDRALAFYCGVLGFGLKQRYGSQAAFISAGGYHHHIGLNTWESAGGKPPAAGTTGLYHHAILYPTRAKLADALRRLIAAGIALDGASDHGVSEALYLRDPDENGVELYWDRPEELWPRTPQGELQMYTRRLDLEGLLGAAS